MATIFKELPKEDVKGVLMQSRRPLVVPNPGRSGSEAYVRDKFIFNAVDTPCFGALTGYGSDKGMHFIFSQNPLSISYAPDTKSKRVQMAGINAVAIPGHVAYQLDYTGTIYVGKIAQDAALESDLYAPVGFTMSNIIRQLQKFGSNKLVVPRNINGEINATGGERVDEQERKYLVLGPDNQEFSVGNSMSPQDFHVHATLVESYTTFSGMNVYYAMNGAIESINAAKGDTVIIPSGVPHYAQMLGTEPTFVMMASSKPIFDKFVIRKSFLARNIASQLPQLVE